MKDKQECPLCLFGSGIVADGKGTKCRICGGTGKVSKKQMNTFNDILKP